MNPVDKQDGIILNLLPIANLALPSVGNIIAPLIYWLLKKDHSPYVNQMGKNVLNFNISISIYMLVSLLLCIILVGFVLLSVVLIVWFVFTIVGLVKATNGEFYLYPLTIKFIK